MAKIIIVDDQPYTAEFLKKALEGNGHEVALIGDGWAALIVSMFRARLILINQVYRHGSGWLLFNHLKEISSKLSMMLYFMDACNLSSARWIVEAVDKALAYKRKEPHAFVNPDRVRNVKVAY